MKKLLAILAAITAIGITLPATASADHSCNRRIVSYTSCGRPVYAYYQIVGYDRCGHPVGQWVTQNANCSCSRCNSHSHHSSHSSHHGWSHSSHGSRSSSSCDRGRSGFRIQFGW
ncbi:MAG: hypothetical protein KDK99_18520 [Verrucomicrobiales bacterium]|nr:hypothetical protein [Verrucomicrobiales bacterium]